jgi:hypothetical protein
MNKTLLIKGGISILLLVIIVVATVIVIRYIVKSTQQRCDADGTEWSSLYRSCVPLCPSGANQHTDPTDSYKCVCDTGHVRNSDGDCVITGCDDGYKICGDNSCIPNADCCVDGSLCDISQCYIPGSVANTGPYKCCDITKKISVIQCPTGPTGAMCTVCVGGTTGHTAHTGGITCSTGLYKSPCTGETTGTGYYCCETGYNCSRCVTDDVKCCVPGKHCEKCPDDGMTCCWEGAACYSYKKDGTGNSINKCCTGTDRPDNYGTCCDPTAMFENKCCTSTICNQGSSSAECCGEGFGCDPKNKGKCSFICGNNATGTIYINGVPQPGGPVFCDCGPNATPSCSENDICWVKDVEKDGKIHKTYACQGKGLCSQWGAPDTVKYYPDTSTTTKNSPLMCTQGINAGSLSCAGGTQYCYTDGWNTDAWRRKGVLGYLNADSFTGCTIHDCVGKATSGVISDYIDFNNTEGNMAQACSWLEKPSELFPVCSTTSNVCPKDLTTPNKSCCADNGAYITKDVSTKCLSCDGIDLINPLSDDDRNNCVMCSGTGHGGSVVNGACQCNIMDTGVRLGSADPDTGDKSSDSIRPVTIQYDNSNYCATEIPCANRAGKFWRNLTDSPFTAPHNPLAKCPDNPGGTSISNGAEPWLGCQPPNCTYNNTTTNVSGCYTAAICGPNCKGDASSDDCMTSGSGCSPNSMCKTGGGGTFWGDDHPECHDDGINPATVIPPLPQQQPGSIPNNPSVSNDMNTDFSKWLQ